MPNQITDRNTRTASAASVSSCAVGGSIPGTSEDQFATRMNRKSVPMNARYGAGSRARRVADLGVERGDDQFQRGLRLARQEREPPGRREPPISASTAMIAHVVTTGCVIGTGPIWNRTSESSGRVHHPDSPDPAQHDRTWRSGHARKRRQQGKAARQHGDERTAARSEERPKVRATPAERCRRPRSDWRSSRARGNSHIR